MDAATMAMSHDAAMAVSHEVVPNDSDLSARLPCPYPAEPHYPTIGYEHRPRVHVCMRALLRINITVLVKEDSHVHTTGGWH